jgi:DNA-binding MarR family transcriptional regulator
VGRVARRLRHLYAATDAAGGTSFTELGVLSRLERIGAMSPTALASAERITPQAVGTVLSHLASRGLIERRPDPADGRRLIVTISDAGRAAISARTEIVTNRLAAALREGFAADELRRLEDVRPLLDRLAERL